MNATTLPTCYHCGADVSTSTLRREHSRAACVARQARRWFAPRKAARPATVGLMPHYRTVAGEVL